MDAVDAIYEVILCGEELPRLRCSRGAMLFPVGRAHGDIVQYHCEHCPHIVEKTRMELLTYHTAADIIDIGCQRQYPKEES